VFLLTAASTLIFTTPAGGCDQPGLLGADGFVSDFFLCSLASLRSARKLSTNDEPIEDFGRPAHATLSFLHAKWPIVSQRLLFDHHVAMY
jgi:hypothetical protein